MENGLNIKRTVYTHYPKVGNKEQGKAMKCGLKFIYRQIDSELIIALKIQYCLRWVFFVTIAVFPEI